MTFISFESIFGPQDTTSRPQMCHARVTESVFAIENIFQTKKAELSHALKIEALSEVCSTIHHARRARCIEKSVMRIFSTTPATSSKHVFELARVLVLTLEKSSC